MDIWYWQYIEVFLDRIVVVEDCGFTQVVFRVDQAVARLAAPQKEEWVFLPASGASEDDLLLARYIQRIKFL